MNKYPNEIRWQLYNGGVYYWIFIPSEFMIKADAVLTFGDKCFYINGGLPTFRKRIGGVNGTETYGELYDIEIKSIDEKSSKQSIKGKNFFEGFYLSGSIKCETFKIKVSQVFIKIQEIYENQSRMPNEEEYERIYEEIFKK